MLSAEGIAALVVMAAMAWAVWSSERRSRIWQAITLKRTIHLGTFLGGWMFGPLLVKMAFGAIGGVGVLAIGDVIDIGPVEFGLFVLLVIVALVATRETAEEVEEELED